MIQEGLAAKAAGDEATATTKLGPRRPARRRDRQRRGDVQAAQGRRRRQRGRGHRPAQGRREQGRRDGARHRVDQDHPDQEVTMRCPAGHETHLDRLLRHLRRRDGRRRPGAPAPTSCRSPSRSTLGSTGECPNCPASQPRQRAVLRGLRLRLHHRLAAAARPSPSRRPRPIRPPPRPYRPPPKAEWVAEIWIDADWYADQEATDPLPSPGLPTVVALAKKSDPDRPRLAEPQHPPRARPRLRQRHQSPARPAHHRRLALVRRGPRLLQRHLRRPRPARSRRPRSPRARSRRSAPTTASTSAPGPASSSARPRRARSDSTRRRACRDAGRDLVTVPRTAPPGCRTGPRPAPAGHRGPRPPHLGT